MRPESHLVDIVDRFSSARVVLLGDLVLDRFILGTPKRISREAPVIILRCEDQNDIPGGGANALANLRSLGVTVVPVGVVGDDEPGSSLLAALVNLGVDTSRILRIPGFKTPTKVRILGGGPSSLKHQVARYDIEDTLPADSPWIDELIHNVEQAVVDAQAVAVSDYGYGVVSNRALECASTAAPDGCWMCLDSRYRVGDFRGIGVVTPNLQELEAWAGCRLRLDDEVAEHAEKLRRHLDAQFVLATRGNQGMTLTEVDKRPLHIPVFGTDEVADVTGAGDTVLATLVAALAAGANPADAAQLSNIAGGLVVMKLGTATVSHGELHRVLATIAPEGAA